MILKEQAKQFNEPSELFQICLKIGNQSALKWVLALWHSQSRELWEYYRFVVMRGDFSHIIYFMRLEEGNFQVLKDKWVWSLRNRKNCTCPWLFHWTIQSQCFLSVKWGLSVSKDIMKIHCDNSCHFPRLGNVKCPINVNFLSLPQSPPLWLLT